MKNDPTSSPEDLPETSPASDTTQSAPIERVAFVSLGCPKNLVDSEKMLGLLAEDGIVPTADHADADAIVVNTCGFLEAAKEESLGVIQEAAERKKEGTLRRLVVAGCLVQRHRAKMFEWCPEIDALIGVFDRDHIIEAVRGESVQSRPDLAAATSEGLNYWVSGNALVAAKERGLNTVGLTVSGKIGGGAGGAGGAGGGKGIGYFESDATRLRLTPRHYTYLRISEGCNQHCTFCTIPSIRGKMRSKPVANIVSELRELFADGAFEINLIGQDTTSFGYDLGYEAGLAGMLRAINQAAADHGGAWLRLMYAYPSYFTDEMIDTIAELEHVVKYIDIPLQHINDRVLDSMERHTSRQLIEDLLYKLRDRIPGIAIRTTMITGFPGETDAEHAELVQFIGEFGFDNLGVFEYSPEPGTKAFKLESHTDLLVPAEVKKQRYAELMETQQRMAFEQMAYLASFYQGSEIQSAEGRGNGDSSEGNDTTAPAGEALQFDILIDRATETLGTLTPGVNAESDAGLYVGRTYFQAPEIDSVTYVQARERLSPGELVRCTIVDADGYDLIARPTAELEKRTSLPILH